LSRGLGLNQLGRTHIRHMSFGAYHGAGNGTEDGPLFARGTFADGAPGPLSLDRIAEDVAHAWYQGDLAHPAAGQTRPDVTADGYSWCKAPRLDGQVAEVGALSRQLVAGHPLAMDMAWGGANVEARVAARMLEVALVVPEMERWLAAIDPAAPFITHASNASDGAGAGLTEAARGSLGHWLQADQGRIANYQIIAPTTWNFSPRDAAGVPGPLEQALEGAPIRAGEAEPVAVQHIVRSFDPCMVCTVH